MRLLAITNTFVVNFFTFHEEIYKKSIVFRIGAYAR